MSRLTPVIKRSPPDRAGGKAKLLQSAQAVGIAVERVEAGHRGMNPLSAR